MVEDIYLVANSTTLTDIEGINCSVHTTQVEKNSAKNYFNCNKKLKNDRFLEFRAARGSEVNVIGQLPPS